MRVPAVIFGILADKDFSSENRGGAGEETDGCGECEGLLAMT